MVTESASVVLTLKYVAGNYVNWHEICAFEGIHGGNGLTLAWTLVIKLEAYDSDEFCRRRYGKM